MLACKEAILGVYDSTSVADALLITATTKPSTAQVTVNAEVPYSATLSPCNEVKLKRIAGKLTMHFTNSDPSNDLKVYYEVYVDGVLCIDKSTGATVPKGSTLSAVDLLYQTDPADEDVDVTVFLWAQDSTHITLDTHRLYAGFGSELSSAVAIRIEKSYLLSQFIALASTGATWSWTLKAANSAVALDTGTNSAAPSESGKLWPHSQLYLAPLTDEIVYLTGVSLV